MLTRNEQLGIMTSMVGLATIAEGDARANDLRADLELSGMMAANAVNSDEFDAEQVMGYARDGVKFITEQLDLLEKSLTEQK